MFMLFLYMVAQILLIMIPNAQAMLFTTSNCVRSSTTTTRIMRLMRVSGNRIHLNPTNKRRTATWIPFCAFQTSLKAQTENLNNTNASPTQLKSTSAVELKYMEFTPEPNAHHRAHHTSSTSESPSFSELPPVILLHGLLGQKRNFSSLGTSLASQLKSPRRIFALDLRNHGDNSHDWRQEMSYSHMASDVLHFMNQMTLDKAVLVGHSMGGKVAQSLALSHPHRIDGLVILDIAPVTYTSSDPSWSAVQNILETIHALDLSLMKTKRDVEFAMRSTISDPALRAFILTNLDFESVGGAKRLIWKIHLDAIVQQLSRIASFDVDLQDPKDHPSTSPFQRHEYLGDTFVIKGGSSTFIKNSHMESISKLFPNYMLTTVKGVGHWVHAEAPDATLALLKTYLDR